MTDSAAIGPIVGPVNAEFFAEYGFLEYFIVVVPLASVVSGLLSASIDCIRVRRQLRTAE